MKTIESGIEKRRAVYRGRRISNATVSLILSFIVTAAAQSERINQEGRILGPAPVVTTPTLFNTPEADAIVSAMQIFPVTNPWNEDISRHPHSIADHVREKNETAVMALASGSSYKIPKRAKATLTILNGP